MKTGRCFPGKKEKVRKAERGTIGIKEGVTEMGKDPAEGQVQRKGGEMRGTHLDVGKRQG